MITFAQFCVGLVVSAIMGLFSSLMGVIAVGGSSREKYDWAVIAWLVSTLLLGICFTIILYQNGVIK